MIVTNLYRAILEFEVNTVCQFSRHTANQAISTYKPRRWVARISGEHQEV